MSRALREQSGPTALTGDWGDLAEDGAELPSLDDMMATEQAKKAQRAMLAAADEAGDGMEVDDAWVCEWDAAAWEAEPTEALCTFIAGRLEEPQVRIVRAVIEEASASVGLQLLAATERCMHNGGMLVEETGKPRTKGGIFVKLLRDATPEMLSAEAQAAALNRIKREGVEAKKATQRALTAKRAVHAKRGAEAAPTHAGRPKASLADFVGAALVR